MVVQFFILKFYVEIEKESMVVRSGKDKLKLVNKFSSDPTSCKCNWYDLVFGILPNTGKIKLRSLMNSQ